MNSEEKLKEVEEKAEEFLKVFNSLSNVATKAGELTLKNMKRINELEDKVSDYKCFTVALMIVNAINQGLIAFILLTIN